MDDLETLNFSMALAEFCQYWKESGGKGFLFLPGERPALRPGDDYRLALTLKDVPEPGGPFPWGFTARVLLNQESGVALQLAPENDETFAWVNKLITPIPEENDPSAAASLADATADTNPSAVDKVVTPIVAVPAIEIMITPKLAQEEGEEPIWTIPRVSIADGASMPLLALLQTIGNDKFSGWLEAGAGKVGLKWHFIGGALVQSRKLLDIPEVADLLAKGGKISAAIGGRAKKEAVKNNTTVAKSLVDSGACSMKVIEAFVAGRVFYTLKPLIQKEPLLVRLKPEVPSATDGWLTYSGLDVLFRAALEWSKGESSVTHKSAVESQLDHEMPMLQPLPLPLNTDEEKLFTSLAERKITMRAVMAAATIPRQDCFRYLFALRLIGTWRAM